MQKYKVYINKECKVITHNWDDFCAKYILIEAAGGLVYNSVNQVLMIFRNKKWDLPKGKIELGESIEECALREVEEECGISNLQIIGALKSTYHIYKLNGRSILKRTYWFKMNTNYSNKLIPQIEEGITKVEWVNKEDISKKIENTYMNIKDIFIDE